VARPPLNEDREGLKNSVICVIPVTETNPKNNQKTHGIVDRDKNIDHLDKLHPIWKGGDIWGCDDCNDRGDRHYMKIHPCKKNKKK
jgi:hypothetical protein